MTNDDIERARLITGLAKRATTEPDNYFWGWALYAYQQHRGLDRPGLALWLNTDEATLDLLAICRRPTPAMPAYRQHVEVLAAHFAIPIEKLAAILRRAETLAAASPNPTDAGLMAARDREDTDDE